MVRKLGICRISGRLGSQKRPNPLGGFADFQFGLGDPDSTECPPHGAPSVQGNERARRSSCLDILADVRRSDAVRSRMGTGHAGRSDHPDIPCAHPRRISQFLPVERPLDLGRSHSTAERFPQAPRIRIRREAVAILLLAVLLTAFHGLVVGSENRRSNTDYEGASQLQAESLREFCVAKARSAAAWASMPKVCSTNP